KRAEMVLDLEEKVADVVKRLKERGLTSPYLRTFVVARINPLRWIKGDPPELEDVLKTMRDRATKFNVEKIKPQDLASMAGAPPESSNRLRQLRLRASSLIRIVFSFLRILWSLRFLLWGVLLTWLTWLT